MKKKNDQLIQIAKKIFQYIELDIPNLQIKELLLKHPDYPNVKALSSLFSMFKIKNKIGKLEINQLIKLQPFFLAQVFNEGFVIVKDLNSRKISYYSNFSGNVKEDISEFNKKWNGIVILLDYSSLEIKKKDRVKKNKEVIFKNRLILLFISIFLFLLLTKPTVSFFSVLLITKFSGLLISSLIAYIEINKHGGFRFCNINAKVSCEDVLNSKAARINDWLTMSDIGLVYFLMGFFSLNLTLFITDLKDIIYLINLISIFALPYILFSVYYQYRILKRWCSLCLSILLVIGIEGVISVFLFLKSNYNFSLYSLLFTILTLIISTIIWSYIKDFFINYFKFKKVYYPYFRLKRNMTVFNEIQNKETSFNFEYLETKLIIGKENKPNTITLVINPFCEFCEKEFNEVFKLYENHKKNLILSIVFIKSLDDQISLGLIELYYRLNNIDFLLAVKKWFEIKDKSKFMHEFKINGHKESFTTLENHSSWCMINRILVTPLVIFNNNRLSNHYSIYELDNLLSSNLKE